jgi:hypothetical protein
VDASKVSQGQLIAGIAGVALLIIMFFSWYGIGGEASDIAGSFGVDTTANAWQSFDFTDLLMFLTCLVAIGGAAAQASGTELPFPAATATFAAGAVMTLLVLYRIVNQPGPNNVIDVKFGAYLGLLACAAIAYGGMRAQSESPVAAAAPPPPPPPPPAPPAAE